MKKNCCIPKIRHSRLRRIMRQLLALDNSLEYADDSRSGSLTIRMKTPDYNGNYSRITLFESSEKTKHRRLLGSLMKFIEYTNSKNVFMNSVISSFTEKLGNNISGIEELEFKLDILCPFIN